MLASDVEAWVGVDVLTNGGGVFFRPWIVVWVKVRVLEDCFVIGGVVRVFFVCLEWLCILFTYRFYFKLFGYEQDKVNMNVLLM